MKNVETQVTGNKLIITVDLTKTFGPSKTGKTTIVASTEGFSRLSGLGNLEDLDFGNVSLNLNVVKAK